VDALMEEFDSAGLIGGERGFKESVVVDENSFREKKLLERVWGVGCEL
jgi:hypothetical protein